MMEVDHLSCGDCRIKKDCPNMANPRVTRARSPFMCSCLPSIPCRYFKPVFGVFEAQTRDMSRWLAEFERQWMPRPASMSTVSLVIDGNQNVRYQVRLSDWIQGSIFAGSKLKTISKVYYKRTREGAGYRVVTEKIGWIDLNDIPSEGGRKDDKQRDVE